MPQRHLPSNFSKHFSRGTISPTSELSSHSLSPSLDQQRKALYIHFPNNKIKHRCAAWSHTGRIQGRVLDHKTSHNKLPIKPPVYNTACTCLNENTCMQGHTDTVYGYCHRSPINSLIMEKTFTRFL